jgi:hypothetical protein
MAAQNHGLADSWIPMFDRARFLASHTHDLTHWRNVTVRRRDPFFPPQLRDPGGRGGQLPTRTHRAYRRYSTLSQRQSLQSKSALATDSDGP